MYRRDIAQTKTLHSNETMVIPRSAGLAKTIQASVEVLYLTGHLAATVRQTEENFLKLRINNSLLRITVTQ